MRVGEKDVCVCVSEGEGCVSCVRVVLQGGGVCVVCTSCLAGPIFCVSSSAQRYCGATFPTSARYVPFQALTHSSLLFQAVTS